MKSPLLDQKSLIPSFPQNLNKPEPIPTSSTPKQPTKPTQPTQTSKLPETINKTQTLKRGTLSNTKAPPNFKKVDVKVNLSRSPPQGFGIGLARDRSQEGVFVVSIMPTGVAAQDARLVLIS